MTKKVISTDKAPAAVGPYSQAIKTGNLLFVSGQIPINPATNTITGDIQSQTRQVLDNLRAVLAAGGGSLSDIVKTTVFLKSLNDFSTMNEVYRQYFIDSPPARSTVEVAGIPKGALVEIEAIAIVKT